MSHHAFVCSHRVTYAECTLGNHVYYARYLDILEKARGEFFRNLGQPLLALQNRDLAFPVLECRLKYLSPARYDDVLQIRLRLTFLKGVRLSFAYDILGPTGNPVLEAETFHCCASLSEKPRRLPEDLHQLLAQLLHDHP
jgi:acyl-CoA thioester hydrolase